MLLFVQFVPELFPRKALTSKEWTSKRKEGRHCQVAVSFLVSLLAAPEPYIKGTRRTFFTVLDWQAEVILVLGFRKG